MANPQDYLTTLREVCEPRTEADFDQYSQAIEALRARPSPATLAGMLRCLRDTEAGEIQYELVEACEAYDDATYAREFAAAADEIRANAPQWGRLLFQSLLNSDRGRESLVVALRSLPPAAGETCRSWASEIAADYEPGNQYEQFASSYSDAG